MILFKVGERKDAGEKPCRRLIDLVTLLEQVESELVAGKKPLLNCDQTDGDCDSRRGKLEKRSLVHVKRAHAPNDPKLSDRGAWRGSCEGGPKDSIKATEKGGSK